MTDKKNESVNPLKKFATKRNLTIVGFGAVTAAAVFGVVAAAKSASTEVSDVETPES